VTLEGFEVNNFQQRKEVKIARIDCALDLNDWVPHPEMSYTVGNPRICAVGLLTVS